VIPEGDYNDPSRRGTPSQQRVCWWCGETKIVPVETPEMRERAVGEAQIVAFHGQWGWPLGYGEVDDGRNR